MTTLYKPVLIETAEQAEALPEGTVALQSWGHGTTARTLTDGRWVAPSGSSLPHAETVGFTALVPIEAEEQWVNEGMLSERAADQDFIDYLSGKRDRPMTRLVTPWEEA